MSMRRKSLAGLAGRTVIIGIVITAAVSGAAAAAGPRAGRCGAGRPLYLIPAASVDCCRDDAGEVLVLGNYPVVDPGDGRPAVRVAQDHALVAGEVLHADWRLGLRDTGGRELALQEEHRDALQLRRVGPHHRAIPPEPHVGDGALRDPAILVHQQALVKACGQRGLAEPVLTPAADVLEPGKRPLEMRRSHRVRTVRPVLRPANGDDHPGPVAIDADTGVRLAAESMPDAAADLLAAKRPPVHLMVRRL